MPTAITTNSAVNAASVNDAVPITGNFGNAPAADVAITPSASASSHHQQGLSLDCGLVQLDVEVGPEVEAKAKMTSTFVMGIGALPNCHF